MKPYWCKKDVTLGKRSQRGSLSVPSRIWGAAVTDIFDRLCGFERPTPLITLVPTRVTKPLRLSDRGDESTRVEPGSFGAKSALHSCRPSLRDARDSCSDDKSHWSSLA